MITCKFEDADWRLYWYVRRPFFTNLDTCRGVVWNIVICALLTVGGALQSLHISHEQFRRNVPHQPVHGTMLYLENIRRIVSCTKFAWRITVCWFDRWLTKTQVVDFKHHHWILLLSHSQNMPVPYMSAMLINSYLRSWWVLVLSCLYPAVNRLQVPKTFTVDRLRRVGVNQLSVWQGVSHEVFQPDCSVFIICDAYTAYLCRYVVYL